jgi:hypothetical protein
MHGLCLVLNNAISAAFLITTLLEKALDFEYVTPTTEVQVPG